MNIIKLLKTIERNRQMRERMHSARQRNEFYLFIYSCSFCTCCTIIRTSSFISCFGDFTCIGIRVWQKKLCVITMAIVAYWDFALPTVRTKCYNVPFLSAQRNNKWHTNGENGYFSILKWVASKCAHNDCRFSLRLHSVMRKLWTGDCTIDCRSRTIPVRSYFTKRQYGTDFTPWAMSIEQEVFGIAGLCHKSSDQRFIDKWPAIVSQNKFSMHDLLLRFFVVDKPDSINRCGMMNHLCRL